MGGGDAIRYDGFRYELSARLREIGRAVFHLPPHRRRGDGPEHLGETIPPGAAGPFLWGGAFRESDEEIGGRRRIGGSPARRRLERRGGGEGPRRGPPRGGRRPRGGG